MKKLTYEDITKITLTSDGFRLNGKELDDKIEVEEFSFIDSDGKKQLADCIFYMMGEGYVIIAKNTQMKSFITLWEFLENKNINYKDSSRIELEEKWEKEEVERNKKIEYRNKLENNKRPKEKLKPGEMRSTLLEEGEYKQLKYQIYLDEDYYCGTDEYRIRMETKNNIYSEIFFSIEKLRQEQKQVLEKYNKMYEMPGIFDLYIGSYLGTNIICIHDMKEYQEILQYNNKKFNTTYQIREELVKLNFKWKQEKTTWELEVKNEDEEKQLISYLKEKYQNEYPTKTLSGVNQCWECGAYFREKHKCL